MCGRRKDCFCVRAKRSDNVWFGFVKSFTEFGFYIGSCGFGGLPFAHGNWTGCEHVEIGRNQRKKRKERKKERRKKRKKRKERERT